MKHVVSFKRPQLQANKTHQWNVHMYLDFQVRIKFQKAPNNFYISLCTCTMDSSFTSSLSINLQIYRRVTLTPWVVKSISHISWKTLEYTSLDVPQNSLSSASYVSQNKRQHSYITIHTHMNAMQLSFPLYSYLWARELHLEMHYTLAMGVFSRILLKFQHLQKQQQLQLQQDYLALKEAWDADPGPLHLLREFQLQ